MEGPSWRQLTSVDAATSKDETKEPKKESDWVDEDVIEPLGDNKALEFVESDPSAVEILLGLQQRQWLAS